MLLHYITCGVGLKLTTTNNKNNISHVEFKRNQILDRYRERGEKASKGLFTAATRKRLLDELPKEKEEIISKDVVLKLGILKPLKFKGCKRHEVRERVITALIDLELFITTCDTYSEKEVFTPKNIEPLVKALLFDPILELDDPDLKKAEIAKLFINYGFSYLTKMQPKQISRATKQSIEVALDTANFLVQFFRSSDEGKYVSPIFGFERPRD